MTKTPTKAPVPKPASLKMDFMAQATQAAANNMSDKLKDMSFKVPEEFHRRYKSAAAMHGIQMKDILEQSFELWLKRADQ